MPVGKDGKIPLGLFIPLFTCSQKHLGQSDNNAKPVGEKLNFAMELTYWYTES